MIVLPCRFPLPSQANPGLWANIGGPMSRSRSERIRASLLGQSKGGIRCPRIIRLGLRFDPGIDPVTAMTDLLAGEGYGSPEDLLEAIRIPPSRLICRPLPPKVARLEVGHGTPILVLLEQALLLGLCTGSIYDPERPVLWTQGSLTRGLELFDPSGFYA